MTPGILKVPVAGVSSLKVGYEALLSTCWKEEKQGKQLLVDKDDFQPPQWATPLFSVLWVTNINVLFIFSLLSLP